jgi:hypothetical protein
VTIPSIFPSNWEKRFIPKMRIKNERKMNFRAMIPSKINIHI